MRELHVPFAKEISQNYNKKKVQDLQKALLKERRANEKLRKEGVANYTFLAILSVLTFYVGLIMVHISTKGV